MAKRTIKNPQGEEITLSSNELSDADLVLAEVLLEIAAETGSNAIDVSIDELARRITAKGYDPETWNPIH